MKITKIALLFFLVISSSLLLAQGVSIKKDGIVPPNMTSSERDLIASPESGLLVFVTDEDTYYFYNGTEWSPVINGNDNSNMQPSLGISYIIALVGIYPSSSKSVESLEPFVGEIAMFAGNFAPNGWAFCNGQLLSIASNAALFSLIGTYYGGDGETTFALPDLRGRVPMHQGTGPGLTPRSIGEKVGNENVGQ
jgi:microcystin-dependent protein